MDRVFTRDIMKVQWLCDTLCIGNENQCMATGMPSYLQTMPTLLRFTNRSH